jgi:hypothetical protein
LTTHHNPGVAADQPNSTGFPSLLNAVDWLSPVSKLYFDGRRPHSLVERVGERSAPLPPPKPTSFRAKARPSILVVDDDSFNFDLLEAVMKFAPR